MPEETPRPHTVEEMREEFMRTVRGIAKYWGNLPGKTQAEAAEGTAFSILAMLDGSNMNLPGFALIPMPHPDDQKYHENEGSNWFPPFPEGLELADIGGALHEEFHQ